MKGLNLLKGACLNVLLLLILLNIAVVEVTVLTMPLQLGIDREADSFSFIDNVSSSLMKM